MHEHSFPFTTFFLIGDHMLTASSAISVGQNVRFTEEGWQKACVSIDPYNRLVPEMGRGPHRVLKVKDSTAHLDVQDFQHLPINVGILEAVA